MNTKNGKTLNVASASDIHLFHKRVPTSFIIENLNSAFPNTPETGALDIIFLPGDIFDRIREFSDSEVRQAQRWINRLLNICKQWNIKLRVLEGTPSHDRRQSKEFDIANAAMGNVVDCKYVDTLSIEKMEDIGITILYIPDEWSSDNDDTWEQVKEVMRVEGLEKVDFSIMHGMFEYQLPNGLSLPCHKEERYLSITERYIFIGHVHNPSRYKRILAQGSFDRLCFGEEEDKGHYRVECDIENPELDKVTFVVNEGACRFDTIDITKFTLEEAEKHIVECVKKLPDGSWVRLTFVKMASFLALYDSLRDRFPNIHWKTNPVKVDGDELNQKRINVLTEAVPINERNIASLISKRLDDSEYDEEIKLPVLDELAEIVNG